MSEHLIETLENGVCTLTMNRPEARNAMSGPMMQALNEAVPRVAADKNVRAVVLTGAGGAFCAGGDVKGFAAEPSGDKRRKPNHPRRPNTWTEIGDGAESSLA